MNFEKGITEYWPSSSVWLLKIWLEVKFKTLQSEISNSSLMYLSLAMMISGMSDLISIKASW